MSDSHTQRMLIRNGPESVDYSISPPSVWASQTGGSSLPAVILIAGSNAPAAVIDVADYTCDGVADEVQINAALALTDKRPILLVGSFTTAAAIAYVDGVTHDLIGSNEQYTLITANHTGNAIEVHSASLPQNWRIRLSNFAITKGSSTPARGLSVTNGAYLDISNLLIYDCTTQLYLSFANQCLFSHCQFTNGTTGVELVGQADKASNFNVFRHCQFRGNDIGTKLTTIAEKNVFTDCTYEPSLSGDIAIQIPSTASTTDNNSWTDCWFEGLGPCIDFQAGDRNTFVRPHFQVAAGQAIVKVSGFGATYTTIVDPEVEGATSWATLPAGVTLVRSANTGVANVVSHGADPTGVADSTAAIQQAIDRLGTTGGTVTGPLGTYLLSRQGAIAHDSLTTGYCLKIDADATHGPLVFDFPAGTVFKLAASQAANSTLVLVNGASAGYRTVRTTFRGITFDGNYTNGTQTAWTDFGLLTVIYAYEITVEQCTFKDFPYAGAHILRDSRGVKLLNNLFDGTHALAEGFGAQTRLETQDILIQGNRFVCDALAGRIHISFGDNADIDLMGSGMRVIGNVFAGGYNGNMVDLAGVSYCNVIGNVFRDVCDTSGWALDIAHYTNANGTVWDGAFNVVQGNVFFNVRQGINLSGGNGTINSTKYTVGAIGNIVHGNTISSDPVSLKTSLGGANAYPDRFSPAPNAAAVNLATGIKLSGTDITAGSQPVTSSTSTVITNSGGAYTTNAYQNYILVVTGGTGKGQVRKVASNTSTTITVSTAFDVTPDTTSTWRVVSMVGFNKILNNVIHASNNTTVGINDSSWLPGDIFDNTIFNSNTGSTAFTDNNPLGRRRGNKAYANAINTGAAAAHPVYQDENQGTGTIASGTTSVTITHKLGRTPTVDQIRITPSNNPTNDPGHLWVDTIGSTTFAVNCRADPGAGGATFGWSVVGTM